jgi:hypothetical protein
MAPTIHAVQHQVQEWSLEAAIPHGDPFNELEVDVLVAGPGGEMKVPAFWGGEGQWRVRFAPPAPGRYSWRSVCTDPADTGLHGREGVIEAVAYTGDNPLLVHGRLGISADGRHLAFADGTPFLWTGDTWWMGLTGRLRWPRDFQLLARDRLHKGFNVVQIIAGLYPDMPAFDPRGNNQAGYAWEADYARVNPGWFDQADPKIAWLARQGLMPCVVGCWAYFLPWMGIERMKRHWRYLVARWGAMPVTWCLAGEVGMPYYDAAIGPNASQQEADRLRKLQAEGWPKIGHYVRSIDAYHHPITIHPSRNSRDEIADATAIDFEMLQTGHGGYSALSNVFAEVTKQVPRQPAMPVINSEINYEGLMEANAHSIRIACWASLLGGCAGFTYGGNGIWQVNELHRPYGNSPWGGSWGDQPWTESMHYPGATHVCIARRLLERYPWPEFRPHPEWLSQPASKDSPCGHYIAGIPRRVRVAYLPNGVLPWSGGPKIVNLESGVDYRCRYVNPTNGREHPLPPTAGATEYALPVTPITHDWVLVMEA